MPRLEHLEDRTVPSGTVPTFGGNAQHTSLYQTAAQRLNNVLWQTPVDLMPQYSSGELLIHYGAPLVTAGNTVIVPVKTGATDGFEIEARDGATGALKYTLSTDYTLSGLSYNWTPSFAPVLASDGAGGTRLYFAGAGGTVWYVNNPDVAHTDADRVHVAFYGLANYNANPTGFNTTVWIDTPLTSDSQGNIYFGFRVQTVLPAAPPATLNDTNPSTHGFQSGYARIDPSGAGKKAFVGDASGDTANITRDVHNLAPALSNDESTVYVAVKSYGTSYYGYLLGLDSTTLAMKYKVFLNDPRAALPVKPAGLLDDGTASPMIAPDGTVFFGVFGNPYNGSRGWMLHFSADLGTAYTPGAFGWDDTDAIVPASMVPSYHGTSSYLIFTKYNNYADALTYNGGLNPNDFSDGINKIAILDPNSTEVDPHSSSGGLLVMREVMTAAGPTPDPGNVDPIAAHPTREWCINTAAVDQPTDSVLTPSEDGNIYRWNLANGSLTQTINVGTGIGESYVPTIINPNNGMILTINNAKLFAIGDVIGVGINITSSAPDNNGFVVGQTVTYTATVRNTGAGSQTPTGTVKFTDQVAGSSSTTTLATVTLTSAGLATFSTSSLSAGSHFIGAFYGGDNNFSAGRLELVQNVHRSATTTTLVSSPNPQTFGNAVNFTATVTPIVTGIGTPTGMVRFSEGSNILFQEALDATGKATFSISSLSAGSHTIQAAYNSDPIFAASTGDDSGVPQEINQAATTTSDVKASLPSPSQYGQVLTLTATATVVAPGVGTPTGTIAFKEGAALLGNGTLNGAGVATFSTAALSAATHTITAAYSGDANFIASNDTGSATPLVQVINKASTSATVSAPVGTVYFGQIVTYTATVTNTGPGAGSPTGSVGFLIQNGSTFGPSGFNPLHATGANTSQATFITTGVIGNTTQTVTAIYSGDSNFSAASNATNSSPITSAVTQTTVTTNLNNQPFAANWSAVGKVTAVPGKGAGTPGNPNLGAQAQGSITFTATIVTNSNPVTHAFSLGQTFTQTMGTAPLGAQGGAILPNLNLPATLTVYDTAGNPTTLASATYTITAVFNPNAGAGDFAATLPANQGTTTETVVPTNTVTQISVSPVNPAPQVGQVVVITGFVTSVNALVQPLGSVTFLDGATTLGTVNLPVKQIHGQIKASATFSTNTLTIGNHALSVVYNPDLPSTAPDFTTTTITTFPSPVRGQWNASPSNPVAGLAVVGDITTGTLTASPTNGTVGGKTVTFTDTVTAGLGGTPSGLVQFLDGTTTLGATSLNASGVATFSTNSLSVATHSIKAVYNAHLNFQGNTSNTLSYQITKATSTTTLSASSQIVGAPLPTLTATVTSPLGTPTGNVTFVVESDARTAAGQTPGFGSTNATLNPSNLNPFIIGTAALSGGTATIAWPAGVTPDIYEVEAIYGGDASNLASNTKPVNAGPTPGPRGFEMVVPDTSTFLQQVSITPGSPGNSQSVSFVYRARPSANSAFPTSLTAETGALGGSATLIVDNQTVATTKILSFLGNFTLVDSNLTIGTHTVRIQYNGDAGNPTVLSTLNPPYAAWPAGTQGWLPAASTTFMYTRASLDTALQTSTSGVTAALSTAAHGTSVARIETASGTSGAALVAVHVDNYFASAAAGTAKGDAPRMLAGTLTKVRSAVDELSWL
jgi:hypothetical protein